MKRILIILTAACAITACGHNVGTGEPQNAGASFDDVIALGYRAVDQQRPARKPLDEILKFF